MSVEVGSGYVSIFPVFPGFASTVQREISSQLAAAGEQGGKKLAEGVKRGTDRISFAGVVSKAAGFLGILGAAGIAGEAVKMGITTAASLEQAQVGFTTLLGSGQQAKSFLSDLQRFAAATPFELPGLIDSSRLLLGVGVQANNVIPMLTAFGDAAGAVGVGQEAFQRIMLATSQAISAGRFQTADLNQITENGIPVWRILSQAMGKPIPVLRDMAASGDLLASDVLPALQGQMEKDYGGAMARQSQTLAGVWSTLMDTINIGLAGVIKPLVPYLTTVVPIAANVLVDAFRRMVSFTTGSLIPAFRTIYTSAAPVVRDAFGGIRDTLAFIRNNTGWIVPFAVGFGALAGTIGAAVVGVKAFLAVQRAWALASAVWTVLTTSATAAEAGFTAGVEANTVALLANPIGLIVAGLIALGAALYIAYERSSTFRAIVNTAFRDVGAAGMWLWSNALQPVFGFIGDHWRLLISILLPGVGLIIANWHTIAAAASAMWNDVLRPTWDAIAAAWSGLVGAVEAVWTGVLRPTWQAVAAAAVWLWSTILRPTLAFIVTAWRTTIGAIEAVWNATGAPVIRAVAAIVGWLWDTILKITFAIIKAEWTLLVRGLEATWNAIGAPLVRAIAALAGWLWDPVLRAVLGYIRAEWISLNAALVAVWNATGAPLVRAIAAVAGWLWDQLKVAFGGIALAWSAAVGGVKSVWDGVLHPVLSAVVDVVQTAAGIAARAFDGLKDGFANAFNAARAAVVNGWNTIAGWVNDHVIRSVNATFHIGINPVPTFATGGPVFGPGTGTSDSILARLSHGEFVFTAAAVDRIGVDRLNALNQGGQLVNLGPGGDAGGARFGIPGFADGGQVSAAKTWIQAQAGKPYVMGAVGPDAYDCSGLVGNVWALLTGHPLYRRYFSTVNEADGFFKPGLGGPHAFNVGWEGGAGGAGHTVGELDGLYFEATPPHALVGRTNYQPQSSLFTSKGHLDVGGTQTIWGWLYDHTVGEVRAALTSAASGLDSAIPQLGIFGDVFRGIARDAVDLMTFDDGGLLMPGQAGINRGTRPEPVFNAQQWDAVKAAATRPAASGSTIHIYPQRADFTIQDLAALQDRQDALSRVGRAH